MNKKVVNGLKVAGYLLAAATYIVENSDSINDVAKSSKKTIGRIFKKNVDDKTDVKA